MRRAELEAQERFQEAQKRRHEVQQELDARRKASVRNGSKKISVNNVNIYIYHKYSNI